MMHRCEVTSYYQCNYKYLTLAIFKHIVVYFLGRATVADAGQTPRNAVCPPQHRAPPSRDAAGRLSGIPGVVSRCPFDRDGGGRSWRWTWR